MNRLLVAAGVISAMAVGQAETYQFDLWTGQLNGAQEVPANASTATGGEFGAGIVYDSATRLLQMNVAYGLFGFAPLQGDYVASHIHVGPIGVTGPVAVDLNSIHFESAGSKTMGLYIGVVPIEPVWENLLLTGNLYMNIHTSLFPGGEIRGQLVVIPEPGVWALLGLGLGAIWYIRKSRS